MLSVPCLFFLSVTGWAVSSYKKWWNTPVFSPKAPRPGVFKSSVVLSDLTVFLLSQFPVCSTYGAKMHCTAGEINFNMRYFKPSAGTEPSLTFLQTSRNAAQWVSVCSKQPPHLACGMGGLEVTAQNLCLKTSCQKCVIQHQNFSQITVEAALLTLTIAFFLMC